MYDVICVGDVAVDNVYLVDHLPEPDQKIYARALGWQLGGTTCNTAVALKVLGDQVLFLTLVGQDDAGRFVQDRLRHLGVDCRFIQSESFRTPTTQILVTNNGDKAILLFFTPEEINLARVYFRGVSLSASKLVFTSLSLPVYEALVDFDGRIMVSLEEPTLKWQTEAFSWAINHAHTLVLDRRAFQWVYREQPTPATLLEIQKGEIENLIVTMGAQGSLAYSRKEGRVIVTPSVEIQALDTTGAGDVFNAAFIHSYYVLDQPLEEALRYANVVAAFSCEDRGPTLTQKAVQKANYLRGS